MSSPAASTLLFAALLDVVVSPHMIREEVDLLCEFTKFVSLTYYPTDSGGRVLMVFLLDLLLEILLGSGCLLGCRY
jgi:hypothetical protein